MRYLLINMPCIVCIIAAAVLGFYGVEGWGWFLLFALLCGHSFTTKSPKDQQE